MDLMDSRLRGGMLPQPVATHRQALRSSSRCDLGTEHPTSSRRTGTWDSFTTATWGLFTTFLCLSVCLSLGLSLSVSVCLFLVCLSVSLSLARARARSLWLGAWSVWGPAFAPTSARRARARIVAAVSRIDRLQVLMIHSGLLSVSHTSLEVSPATLENTPAV